MSVIRPARCLFSKPSTIPKPTNLSSPRDFHTSTTRPSRRRITPNREQRQRLEAKLDSYLTERAKNFRPYTAAEKEALKHIYTPDQIAAIEAGEATIDPKDLAAQAKPRSDPWRLQYLDDLSKLDPVIDRMPYEDAADVPLQLKTEGEIMEAFIRKDPAITKKYGSLPPSERAAALKEDPTYLAFAADLSNRLSDAYLAMVKSASSTSAAGSSRLEKAVKGKKSAGEDVDENMLRLMQQTGYSEEEIKRFRVKNLVRHRVVNQTRMGKIQSQYYLTIAGNGNGLLGIGEGKSAEDEDARRQAMMNAVRNMQPIPRYEKRTIFGEVRGKVGAVELLLSSRPAGFGVRTQHLLFEMARACGITDLSGRVSRSRNPMNTVKAAFQALQSQKMPEDIARARGRKLVDVRNVYYNGRAG
ncbi:hypothetical protein K402DRAFT_467991 [Aulographum hederae CBS 113979]|uniref:Small ribosomal subunit protein uS5m n=1 Tax=Aulographum hederae CBS 113979 TaxID=1176131 RepID=A0A6G1GIR2_9PEZI|nr:hypothetical protein K402DRAFT_467991 [Aulographum hederae CBS 113979]